MAEDKSWWSLAEEFLGLDPHRSMGVAWNENESGQLNFWFEWHQPPALDFYNAASAQRPVPHSLTEAKFIALAASAGGRLADAKGSTTVNSWLACVVTNTSSAIDKSQHRTPADGRLAEICRESAELCYVIEAYGHKGSMAVSLEATRIKPPRNRDLIEQFIDFVLAESGVTISKTDIWRVAGYREATQFERFQREKNASAGSSIKFKRILSLSPTEFLKRRDKLT